MLRLSSLCTRLSSALSRDLKALFFSLRRAFRSLFTHFVIWVTANLFSGDGVVYAEPNVLRDTVSQAVNVLTMWLIQSIPVCGLQIIWTKSDGDELDIRAADTLFNGDVPGVTPPVVHEHGEAPSFLLAGRGGVSVSSNRLEAGNGGRWSPVSARAATFP